MSTQKRFLCNGSKEVFEYETTKLLILLDAQTTHFRLHPIIFLHELYILKNLNVHIFKIGLQ